MEPETGALLALLIVILMFIFGAGIGGGIAKDNIAESCQRYEAFYVKDQRYTCTLARNLP